MLIQTDLIFGNMAGADIEYAVHGHELTQIGRPRVYFDIKIGDTDKGRVVFELVSAATLPI